jgi:predicted DNA-binding mobile mystery protein A
MRKAQSNLKLKQVDAKLNDWRGVLSESVPKGGWLRLIREALGMTTAQVAQRLDVAQQAVAKFERNEAAGKITLESLARVADALGCKLTYAVVSTKPLAEMQRARARVLAEALTRPVAHSMKLEAQGVSRRALQRQRKLLVEELLRGNPRKLWR